MRAVLAEKVVQADSVQEFCFDFPKGADGMLFFELQALSGNAAYCGGAYECDAAEKDVQPVKIGVDICTFRREPFVMGNIARMRSDILENAASPLHNHLEVFVSDNGQTLDYDKLNSDTVHVVPNANVGGAGGFTRGTLLSLRKPEYADVFVGGAMLRLDRPNIQVENGAAWNQGQLISHKANFDLTKVDLCVANELEERHEYNAWWYCCIPIAVVRPDNLPMPIFIRGDDIEYGLRNCKRLVTLNGICVWHEPFESKYSSSMYYYILRNQCIDANALKADLRSQVMGEVNRYRYKNADLLIRGVRDFLKGIDWLEQTDAEALHKEIMAYGYKAQPVDQLDVPFDYSRYLYATKEEEKNKGKLKNLKVKLTRNGWLVPPTRENTVVSMMHMTAYNAYRVQKVLNYDSNSQKGFVTERSKEEYSRCVREMKACMKEIDAQFDAAAQSYRERCGEVRSLDFWKKYLNLDK